MPRTTRTAALAALAALAMLAPASAAAQNEAACSLMASSYADTVLNPPRGEDTDFFITTGGVPNVMFLQDTSGSMLRVPPDGAAQGWGSFETDPTAAAGAGFGCKNTVADTRTFSSSCGGTTVDGQSYSSAVDWGDAKDSSGRYCPYLNTAGQPMATDKPGYDPDWYPTFFPKDNVYVEALYYPSDGLDGWNSGTATPAAGGPGVAAFCASRGSAAKNASCQTCMDTKGYWFDGTYRTFGFGSPPAIVCGYTSDCAKKNAGTCIGDAAELDAGKERNNGNYNGKAHCKIPRIYFRGNFLNFYPPKFIMARKAMKDILGGVKKFRLGIATFDSSGNGAGATLEDALNPPCNQVNSTSAFYNNRNSVRNNINNTAKLAFTGTTPLAEALLDVSHYYASASLPWFAGTTYDRAAFEEKTGNNASVCFACQKSSVIVLTDGIPTQDSSVPGKSGWSPITKALSNTAGVYAGSAYNITTLSTTDCPSCETAAELADTTLPAGSPRCYGQQNSGSCDDSYNPINAWFPRVAWYVHNMDHRVDTEVGTDGYKMTGKQVLDVYVIGLNTDGNASLILQHAADAGGGKFYNVTNGRDLKAAIDAALDEVNTRSIAFGSAALSTLQASATQAVLVPRFSPSREALWEGHLYAFDLWSEFTGGCSPPAAGPSGPANGDYDCDGKCYSVFLRDKNAAFPNQPGDFITEDQQGSFVKNNPPNRALCGGGNLCAAANCAVASSTPAVPFWDTGATLSPLNPDGSAKAAGTFTDWRQRKIYTVVDDAAPFRKLTSADSLVLLADDDATLTKLLPYLNVVGNKDFCGDIADRFDGAGNAADALAIRNELLAAPQVWLSCARAVVRFAMGADVFNERTNDEPAAAPCATYPGTYCGRAFLLGDVFHSSPVEVVPPFASDGFTCDRGLHPQCLRSIYSTDVPSPSTAGNAWAYDDYAKNKQYYAHRNKFALVGANDGMVHAIQTGAWHAGQDNPKTPQREDLAPYEGYHDQGTGKEIWAFVPPDQLAKMPLLLGTTHNYYVDGSAMVRDVWLDGYLANKLGGATNANGIREGNEMHTVAIMGERRGGTKFLALDVTDAGDDLDARPRFLWIYPQPDSPEHVDFGQTYAEFLPVDPPVGPVRIDTGAPPCANPNNRSVQTMAGAMRCYEERWVVFLNGGFDQQYTKGRGVHMVDLKTGQEVFDFSQPKGPASGCDATKDPRCHLNYPVSGAVGMMSWGTDVTFGTGSLNGYFDTATFGDAGGQLWVLRFYDPGTLDASGKATNWFGARIFQMNKASAPASGVDYCGTQPFFHITANVPLKLPGGYYRVLAGTGDRFNLLDHGGGICSPDNLRACVIKGCSVKIDDGSGGPGAVYGVTDMAGTSSYHMAHNAACGAFDATTYTSSLAGGGGSTCTGIVAKLGKVTINCPAAVACTGNVEITNKDEAVACAGGSCRPTGQLDMGSMIDLNSAADKLNWFYSIRVFQEGGDRIVFRNLAEAIKYDAARLTETNLLGVNARDTNAAAALSTANDDGWKYYFNHGAPNASPADTVTIDGASNKIWRADERVVSTTAAQASCAFWNTMQVAIPMDSVLANTCPVASPCKAGKKQMTYLYGANPETGDLCLQIGGVATRFQQSQTIVPPHIGKLVAYVSAGGQVAFGLTTVRIPQGGTNIPLGEAQDIASLVEWLPVDREMHACRHGDAPYTDGRGAQSCK